MTPGTRPAPQPDPTPDAARAANLLEQYCRDTRGVYRDGWLPDSEFAGSLIADLLIDLMLYADAHAVHMEAALLEARSTHSAYRKRQEPGYRHGDTVQLTDKALRRLARTGIPDQVLITGRQIMPGEPTRLIVRSPAGTREWTLSTDLVEPVPQAQHSAGRLADDDFPAVSASTRPHPAPSAPSPPRPLDAVRRRARP
jgi:hypothetical protein